MGVPAFLGNTAIGLISGFAGIKVMDPVTTKFYDMESEADKQREKNVSPGVAYDIAAKRLTGAVGLKLSDDRIGTVASGFHQGLGLTGGAMYVFFRRRGLGPIASALLMGLGIWAVVDEGMNTAFHFSAPPEEYPLATHLRGLAGHLALAMGAAITAEVLFFVTRSRPSKG